MILLFALIGLRDAQAQSIVPCYQLQSQPFYTMKNQSLSVAMFKTKMVDRYMIKFEEESKRRAREVQDFEFEERRKRANEIAKWFVTSTIETPELRVMFLRLMDFNRMNWELEAYRRETVAYFDLIKATYATEHAIEENDFEKEIQDLFGQTLKKLLNPVSLREAKQIVEYFLQIGTSDEQWVWRIAKPKEFQLYSEAPAWMQKTGTAWQRFQVSYNGKTEILPLLRFGLFFYLPRHVLRFYQGLDPELKIEFRNENGFKPIRFKVIGDIEESNDFVAIETDLGADELKLVPEFPVTVEEKPFGTRLGSVSWSKYHVFMRVRPEDSKNNLLYSEGVVLGRDGHLIGSSHLSHSGGSGFPVFDLETKKLIGVNFDGFGFRRLSNLPTSIKVLYGNGSLLVPEEVTMVYPAKDIFAYHQRVLFILKNHSHPKNPQ